MDSPQLAVTGETAACARRVQVEVEGAVQGVGFRPFVYRLASELGLAGWIRNTPRGVELELEGPVPALEALVRELRLAPPARAVVRELREVWGEARGLAGLRILPSERQGERVAGVLPDLATCDACMADIGLMPGSNGADDRRFGYPFTNCTDCGPRFSIIRAVPYDRSNTTMAAFELCPACRAEYEDPLDRRFHAQPTACPDCGPTVWLEPAGAEWRGGANLPPAAPRGAAAIAAAAAAIRQGAIVALKGLGGFHLVVAATDEEAVARLRRRKRRPAKPLAVMVRDLEMARAICDVPAEAAALLRSPEAPIVLLPRAAGRGAIQLAESVAPGNPYLGVMLPYTPLHHLLLAELDAPVVATSGNRSDEPICTSGAEARERLAGIADLFLLHDRPIERPVDDSVVQLAAGEARPIRRSRGYAPQPVQLPAAVPPILAVGGELKNVIALSRARDVYLSQHIGDLESVEAQRAFERAIADLQRLLDVTPIAIAHDLHPDYASSRWATRRRPAGEPAPLLIPVQHHHAHLAACLADSGAGGRALGVVWDGTGLGVDGTIWGGEFLLGDAAACRRVARLRPFRLPGSDAAVREPRRVALALLHAGWRGDVLGRLERSGAAGAFAEPELGVLLRMLDAGVNAPWTTSMGRLFDATASLLGIAQRVTFEGEAAMALEWAVDMHETGAYSIPVVRVAGGDDESPAAADACDGAAACLLELDWRPAVEELLADRAAGVGVPVAAARFHNGLVNAIAQVAERVGEERVALTGGCFQNRVLLERATARLSALGFEPLLHRQVPANDGGLALGQVAVAAARLGGVQGR